MTTPELVPPLDVLALLLVALEVLAPLELLALVLFAPVLAALVNAPLNPLLPRRVV